MGIHYSPYIYQTFQPGISKMGCGGCQCIPPLVASVNHNIVSTPAHRLGQMSLQVLLTRSLGAEVTQFSINSRLTIPTLIPR